MRSTAPAGGAATARAHVPAPGMPALRPSLTAPAPAHRHVPAPAILPISHQNRAGGAVPKSPYVGSGPAVAPLPRPAVPAMPARQTYVGPAVTGIQAHAANIAHGMPMAEPGGLAEGMAAPRSLIGAAELRAPSLSAIATEQSKYYPGQVVDAASGTHYDAASGRPTGAAPVAKNGDVEIEWDTVTPMSTLVARYLFALTGVLALTCLLAHAYREYYVLTLLGAMFVSGVLLPIMDVVPKQRDDSDDVWVFLGLVMVFGPAIGLIMYAVVGLLRQSANPAIVGCFVVSILAQIAVYLAASPTLLVFGPPWVQQGFDLRVLFVNWCSVASLAGWASANVFHRFDE
jgi:hypothetical protein